MKNLSLLIALVLILGFVGCNTKTTNQETEKQEVLNPVVAEIDVEGMTCTGCENSINKSIHKLEGIVEVSSSHTDKKTVVKYDETKVSLNEIKQAITQTGYTVIEPESAE